MEEVMCVEGLRVGLMMSESGLIMHSFASHAATPDPDMQHLTPVRPPLSGQAVNRSQTVMGVEFSYQPPPKSVVPYAAALKGQHVPR